MPGPVTSAAVAAAALQIVIAGASETGLSCLEHLLLQPDVTFTNLTLLAPGGIRSDDVASQSTAARVACLGLHANITMVDSHMVALETDEQLLMLADGEQLPYDLLAVTTGLQVRSNLAGSLVLSTSTYSVHCPAAATSDTGLCLPTNPCMHACCCGCAN